MLSIFVWEFQLDTGHRRQLVTFNFNDLGPFGPKNESSVMFPLLVAGVPEVPVSPNTTHQAKAKRRRRLRRVIDISLDFFAPCVLAQDNGNIAAYLAIYSHDENGDRKIH